MADAAGAPVLPREAIAFLRAKRLKPSEHWLSIWREEHACAFTVAQMTQKDMLLQTHRGLLRAMRRGETLETFRERLEPWLQEKGWKPKGRGGNLPRRLERIYLTNLRTAAAAGHWERIQRVKAVLPWLIYELGPSQKHREDHAAWAGTCLRVDDSWWSTHYPPNGWGCKCLVRQVDKPPSGARTAAPGEEMRKWKNPATKETIEVPRGIDPGWDFNAAAHAVPGMAQAFTARLQRMAARGGVPGARREAVERLVRGFVRRYVRGPALARLVERDRPAPRVLRARRGQSPVMNWGGRDDLAAPIALLTSSVQAKLGAHTPVVVLTDAGAAHQYWRHGVGMQGLQRRRARDLPVEVPPDRYVEIQAFVDDIEPQPRPHGRWLFKRRDGWRLVLEVEAGVARVITFFHKRGEPRRVKRR